MRSEVVWGILHFTIYTLMKRLKVRLLSHFLETNLVLGREFQTMFLISLQLSVFIYNGVTQSFVSSTAHSFRKFWSSLCLTE